MQAAKFSIHAQGEIKAESQVEFLSNLYVFNPTALFKLWLR